MHRETFINSLVDIFRRELQKLRDEILGYFREEDLWRVAGQIRNSAGNLCLHITGNLQHYIGAILGQTGYRRNRPGEFSRTNVPVKELLGEIEAAREVVEQVLPRLTDQELQADFPENFLGESHSTEFILIHLLGHLHYHLGQINYHRRLLATGGTGGGR